MAVQVALGPVHHLRLTVTDINRSRDFYTRFLGFQVAVESPPKDDPGYEATYPVLWGGIVMIQGNMLLGLRPVASQGDRFDPDRVGLDHLSFNVASRADLDQALQVFDENGVKHGEIKRLAGFDIDILPFFDPDGIALELTAPVG